MGVLQHERMIRVFPLFANHRATIQIRDELYRLMGMWDEDEVVTTVPLSCVRGGPTTLLRTEAVSELRYGSRDPLYFEEF